MVSVWSFFTQNFSYVRVMVQIRGMHTLIRDRDISKHDFIFYSDRLIRLVPSPLTLMYELRFVSYKCFLMQNITDCIVFDVGGGAWSWTFTIY